MSKRTNFTRILSPLGPSRSCFLVVLCILVAALAVGTAQASTVVRINDVGLIPPGDTVTVQVTLDSVTSGLDITGFDFLIAWEPTDFRLIEVQEGQLLNDCGWEYFQFAVDSMADWNWWPPDISTVRIVSVADLNNGDIHPTCNATMPGELVRLVFEVSSHPINYGRQALLRFLWNDCGDNGMALSDGTLLLSDQVYEFGWDWSGDGTFPTWFGAPDECVDQGAVREVDFYNGVVHFAYSDTSSNADAAVYITGERDAWLGWPAAAEIRVKNLRSPWEASGFDLLIQYDNTGLTFTSAELGHSLSVWNWEYFNYVDDPAQGLIRLVAIADINNGDIHPSNLLNQNCALAMLQFIIVNNAGNIGRELPLRFLWADCGDNSFASAPDGDSLYVSNDVYDKYGFLLTANEPFPTYSGVPDECLTAPTVRRSVDYFSSFIQVATEDPTPVYGRGDINLNWVPNEVADWVLFSSYFFYGLGVFNVNVEAQVATTDINADGITLTFSDLAYLYRVIVGDAEPIWDKAGTTTDTAYVIQDTTVNSLSVSYDGNLTMLFLTFNGTAEPQFYDSSGLSVIWTSDGGNTRMIIYPGFVTSEGEQLLPTGFLMNYTGDGQLVGAAAAYDGLTGVPALVQIGQGEQCCVIRGNINHDPEGRLDISDLVYFVSFMFGLGPPPPCPGEADINANGLIEIGDLVSLVDYMFNAGPAPVPCP